MISNISIHCNTNIFPAVLFDRYILNVLALAGRLNMKTNEVEKLENGRNMSDNYVGPTFGVPWIRNDYLSALRKVARSSKLTEAQI